MASQTPFLLRPLALRPFPPLLRTPRLPLHRNASNRAPETDKSRILEKPARFNPPSHGSRRVRPRAYPGPRITDAERETMKTKRYPNMMPPEGSFMWRFLTDRRLHMWITLSTLFSLAIYSVFLSFLHTTAFREQLPSFSYLLSHPLAGTRQFGAVYKLHVAHESEKVADLRRRKLEDVKKREEFLRAHGVEPGFLTGSWVDKFGTVEGDRARAKEKEEAGVDREMESPVALEAAMQEVGMGGGAAVESKGVAEMVASAQDQEQQPQQQQQPRGEKRRAKYFGIW